jgi:hypothetical protein
VKPREAYRLARELAKLTDESMTTAVTPSLILTSSNGSRIGMLDFFWSLTLSQACARPTAVLIDELDAGGF